MGNRPRLTDKDWHTICLALNYAMEDRDGFANSYSGKGPEAERALALVASFEALHQKMFGGRSHRQATIDSFANAPSVKLHDIEKRETP